MNNDKENPLSRVVLIYNDELGGWDVRIKGDLNTVVSTINQSFCDSDGYIFTSLSEDVEDPDLLIYDKFLDGVIIDMLEQWDNVNKKRKK